MKYLRIGITVKVFKNSLKMGFVAVNLTKVLFNCTCKMMRKITLFLKIVTVLLKYHHILFSWLILPWISVSYYVFLIIFSFQVELTSELTTLVSVINSGMCHI